MATTNVTTSGTTTVGPPSQANRPLLVDADVHPGGRTYSPSRQSTRPSRWFSRIVADPSATDVVLSNPDHAGRLSRSVGSGSLRFRLVKDVLVKGVR